MELKKNIGLWSAVSLVIGSIIGSGIFMKPATMAAEFGSPMGLIIVWLVGGIVSLFGAMLYAELGTIYPETGGPYVYLQEIYGDFVAFLYGWSSLAVINTAALAAIAFVSADYTGYFIHLPHLAPTVEHSFVLHIPFVADIYPLQDIGVKSVAIGILVVLTAVNYFSTKGGNSIQFVATLMKALAIAFLIGGILFSGKGNVHHFVVNSPSFHPNIWMLVGAFVAAMSGTFSSYDGWYNINMVAGEIIDPRRNLVRSIFIGVGSCIVLYLLINVAYLYILPIDDMARSPLVASAAMEKVMGIAGGGFVAALIILSTFGATQANFIANTRVTFAMGETGAFFPWAGKVHPRFQTPGNATIIMGVWSILFVFTGSFDILADMFVFMSWVFYGLTAIGLMILRIKKPGLERPYRVNGYPWVPLLFIAFTVFYLIVTVYNDVAAFRSGKAPIINSVFGLLLTAAGIPFYWYFRKFRSKLQK